MQKRLSYSDHIGCKKGMRLLLSNQEALEGDTIRHCHLWQIVSHRRSSFSHHIFTMPVPLMARDTSLSMFIALRYEHVVRLLCRLLTVDEGRSQAGPQQGLKRQKVTDSAPIALILSLGERT
ncbi:hypothetical protein MRB53_038973 [Persea americana]|nr:hypothetical protein MRB53_038973 [Persea americana]